MEESLDQACYKWTEEAISKLIELRYERREDFRVAGKRSKSVWLKIVRDLGLENQITADECKEQWSHLLEKFKEMEHKISDGSCNEELGWPHYNQMQSVISKLQTCEDHVIESTEIEAENHVSYGDGFAEHRSYWRDRQLEIDERFVNAVEEHNQDLKAFNSFTERQGDIFLELMARFVGMFENQAADDVSME